MHTDLVICCQYLKERADSDEEKKLQSERLIQEMLSEEAQELEEKKRRLDEDEKIAKELQVAVCLI